MEKIIITLGGLGLIIGIYWFFFGKKSGEAGSGSAREEARDSWNIIVEGGYRPTTITLPRGKKSTITFTRKDPNSCLEDIIIEDFKIKQFLPLNKPVTITISPARSGTFSMHCAMNMFHGNIIVTS